MTDPLTRLQDWYTANCSGVWEHTYGVSIETLDNPGWSIRIDLGGTKHSGRKLDRIENGIEGCKKTWTSHWVAENQFHAAGGVSTLARLIACFLDWADAQYPT